MSAPYASVRPEVRDFTPYSPGLSIDEIKERYKLSQVIKLASNENPLGASTLVQKAVQQSAALSFRYPQSGSPRLRAAIARHHGLPLEKIVAGNGSDEIIDLLIRAKAIPGIHNIVTCKPCFSMYTLQTRLSGAELRQVPVKADFSFDFQALREAVDENTVLIFLTSPDNPSGFCPAREDVLAFARALPPAALLVVDEAYMDFAEDEEVSSILPLLAEYPNIAVLRTFSKSWGLAGLRAGYGILPEELTDYLLRIHLPFSVNILAEEAALAALEDKAFRAETLRVTREGRCYLMDELANLGCAVHPSQANFLMFGLPRHSPYTAVQVFEELLKRGIIIRPLSSYGLPDKLRVSIGNAIENRIFITALNGLLDPAGQSS